MSKLKERELLEQLCSSFDQERIWVRGLRYAHDISQEECEERIGKINQAYNQIVILIKKSASK